MKPWVNTPLYGATPCMAIAVFKDKAGLFFPNVEAQCKITKNSAEFEADAGSGHAGFHVKWHLSCENLSKIHVLSTSFFKIFPKAKEIEVDAVADKGSLKLTEIKNGVKIDNLVHIAHNVKIGSNCMIAGQVGFAGSSRLGNNVSIGGQAGISGHLKIGNNVEIAGGSGVIKDIPDNSKVMGYPAKNIREFLKDNK